METSHEQLLGQMKEMLAGRRMVIASNREPYVHRKLRGEVRWERPAGGVTAALDPLMRLTNGIWVAWGSGDADRMEVDRYDRVRVPPDSPSYTLRRVWLTQDEVAQYYYGYSNRFLWPLCHMTLDRVVFRQKYWSAYQNVNEKFTQAILSEIKNQAGLVWIHDYHLALCPMFLRKHRPDIRIALFWHIPWPSHDVFRICPQRKEMLSALLACDQLGFHLNRYCQSFLECVERELDAKVKPSDGIIEYQGHRTRVSPLPVSIDFKSVEEMSRSSETTKRMTNLRKRLKVKSGTVIGLGVDRLDYTKGLLNRLWAIEEFLSRFPEYLGRFVFIQIAAPSRAESKPYQQYRGILHSTVQEINLQFSRPGWKPIEYIEGQLSHEALAAYYRLASFCLISSVYDGMNLVSKEYVASRVEEPGVLVLSEMAGSLEELEGALPINPYDVEGMAQTIRRAVEMPREERKNRMDRMRAHIKMNDVYRWMNANLAAMIHPVE